MRLFSVITLFFFSVSIASAGFADFNFGSWSMGPKKGTQTLAFSADLTSTASVLSPARGTGPGTFTGGGQWVADNSGVLQFVASGNPAIPGSRIAANVCYDTLLNGTPIAGINGVLFEPARTNKVTGYSAIPADSLGTEKVSDVGFDTPGLWTCAANWSVSSGAATSNGGTGLMNLTTTPGLVNGRVYELTVVISAYTSGTVFFYDGGGPNYNSPVSGVGTFTRRIVCVTNGLYLNSASFNGSITSYSCKEVILATGTRATSTSTAAVPGMTLSGDAAATLSVVDDTAALAAAGLQNICSAGKVYKLDNSGGTVSAFATVAGATGNTNPHSAGAYMRTTGSGGAPRLGWVDTVGSEFGSTSSAAYVLCSGANQTPSSSARSITVTAFAGRVVYFTLPQLEEGENCTSHIVTAGATATRSQTTLSFPTSSLRGYMTVTVEATPAITAQDNARILQSTVDGSNYWLLTGYTGTAGAVKYVGGVQKVATAAPALTAQVTYKFGIRNSPATGLSTFKASALTATNVDTSALPIGPTLAVGGSGVSLFQGQIKNLRIYWDDASDAKMIQRTQ